jgi:HAMP domain-containing protein
MSIARMAGGALLFLACTLVITVGIAVILFDIPVADLPAVTWLLASVGGGGLLMLLVLHPSILGCFGSVRRQLVVANLAGNLVLLGMILAGAHVMFFSDHDLALLLTMLLFAALLAAGFSVLWATLLAQRIERVRAGTAQLASGNLQATLPVQGNDEIAQLAADFNRMSASLNKHGVI